MGRRIKLKAVRKQKGKRERKNVRDDPNPNPNPNLNPDPDPGTSEEKKKKLTAFDLINILTREHLKEMLNEYDIVSEKHNQDLNIRCELESCRDLRKEETSRFDQLKYGYFKISEDRYVEEIIKLEKGKGKGKGKGSSSTFKKKVDPHPEMENFIEEDKFENIKGLHIYNIELFCANINYTSVGFPEFRYNQCPNVHEASNLLEMGDFSNRVLQETMLVLNITEEDMISEYIKENEIRILSFGLRQERSFVNLVITIPEICQCNKKNISFRCTETGLFFYVENHNEKKYVFEMENFANKINKNSSSYTLSGKHTVLFHLKKMKQGRWKQLFSYKNQTKDFWEFEMQNILMSMNPEAQLQMESIDFVLV
ncbi:hypothetical protein Avbf_00506 [Armadillidium vulgare]|nr:hypothetical protein Avbf_00506 [Armadillidium vulgare]